MVSWGLEEVEDAGDVGAFVVLPHEVDEVDEVFLDEGVTGVEGLHALLLLKLFLVELVVLAKLLRFLIKGLGVGLALVQLLTVDALLRHFEGHLQRHKLLLRGDHFL